MSAGPWWWIAAAILLGAAEMLTVSLVLVWSALAAAVTALVLWLWPGLGLAAQVGLFALLSIAFTFGGRALVLRFGDGAGVTRRNHRTAELVGREAVVVRFAGAEGQVTVDGVPWPARLAPGDPPPRPRDRVRISGANGIVLTVQTLPRGESV